MTPSKKELADKFFNNRCTAEEAEKVLDWLDGPEGREYLNEKMDSDFSSSGEEADESDEPDAGLYMEMNPDRHFNHILKRIALFGPYPERKFGFFKPFLQVAAAILVIVAASVFFYRQDGLETANEGEADFPTELATTAGEQREVALKDGTVIHLNENTRIFISEKYMREKREIILKGEAYFEVAHQPDMPFVIHAGYSEVEVLGTSFNVNATPGRDRVEVAVVEGKVAFRGNDTSAAEPVILQKGQYGYLDVAAQKIAAESFGAENYLAWKSGQFVFDELSLDQVCIQLVRFYGVACRFEEETIRERKLTANFPSDDLENTLSVIALSLDLNYRTDGRQVFWNHDE